MYASLRYTNQYRIYSEVAQKLSNIAPYCFASFETEIMFFLTYYVS